MTQNYEILEHPPFLWPANLEYQKTTHFNDLGTWKYLKAPSCLGHLRKNPFWEHGPGKMNMVTLELRSKQTLFSKWLPRPNHYAHEICIEILCRTPVSILKYLSPRPQNHTQNSKYSLLAWMSRSLLIRVVPVKKVLPSRGHARSKVKRQPSGLCYYRNTR